jgi:uncharacterized protein (TIGR02145 family)
VIFLLFAGFMSTGLSDQVNVGSTDNPHDGAILDLYKASHLGVLLPHIALIDVKDWKLNGAPDNGKGMIVYNTNDYVFGGSGSGVYLWDGSAWLPIMPAVNVTSLNSFDLPATLSIQASKSAFLMASNFKDNNNQPMTGIIVTWSVNGSASGSVTTGSNRTIVTAGSSGGTFTVKATAGSITKLCVVTVTVTATGSGTGTGTAGKEKIGNNEYHVYTYPNGTTWMVENSREGSSSHIDSYGRYYMWWERSFACPTGWAVPAQAEWETLKTYINGSATSAEKAMWNLGLALAGLFYSGDNTLNLMNNYGYWWSDNNSNNNHNCFFAGKGGNLQRPLDATHSIDYLTVRCIKR